MGIEIITLSFKSSVIYLSSVILTVSFTLWASCRKWKYQSLLRTFPSVSHSDWNPTLPWAHISFLEPSQAEGLSLSIFHRLQYLQVGICPLWSLQPWDHSPIFPPKALQAWILCQNTRAPSTLLIVVIQVTSLHVLKLLLLDHCPSFLLSPHILTLVILITR